MIIKTKKEAQLNEQAQNSDTDTVISVRMKLSAFNELKKQAKSENRNISNYIKTKLNITN